MASYHKPRRFENLETRTLMAGNVAASLDGGCLNISGGAQSEQFIIRQLQNGDWSVTGVNKTKINGQKFDTFSDVQCINIKTQGGNDAVAVVDGCLSGPLCIDTGAGTDLVALAALKVGSVDVSTGAGNDALIVAGLKIESLDSTTDLAPLTTTTRSSSANFNVGDGTNIVLLAAIQAPNLSLCSGKGNDYIGLVGVCVDECLSIDTGKGIDMLGVIGCSASLAKLSNGAQPGDLLAAGGNSFDHTSSNFNVVLNLDPLVKLLNQQFKSIQKSMLSSMNLSDFSSLKI
jgi:hypothetical protein